MGIQVLPCYCISRISNQNYPCLSNNNNAAMCVNQRWITNKYTGQRIYVKCGHCKACLQEKAFARSNRIRSEYSKDTMTLFVGLTYDRDSCPYIIEDELHARVSYLHIYRAYSLKRSYDKERKRFYRKRVWEPVKLSTVYFPDYRSIGSMRSLAHRFNRYGVCYYRDYQDFIKNLRLKLQRNYNCYEKFKIFTVSEYGSTTKRPHFHFLMFIKPSLYETFRDAICEAWPFADLRRQMRYSDPKRWPIQIASGDASRYVSSYVNCGSSFPSFLANNFAPKHSHSKLFGHNSESFLLSEIQKGVDRGNVVYTRQTSRDGVQVFVDLPIPKYVINKFFPIFKGYSRLTGCEVSNYIYNPQELRRVFAENLAEQRRPLKQIWSYDKHTYLPAWNLCYHSPSRRYELFNEIGYTSEDIDKICVRLDNAFKRYHKLTGNDRFTYTEDFVKTWNAWKSTVHKAWRTESDCIESDMFVNLDDFFERRELGMINENNSYLDLPLDSITDNNEAAMTRSKTIRLEQAYDFYYKEKDLTNAIRDKNQFACHKLEGLV